MASEVISALNKIHGRAAHACDSAPKCMDARWAKDYVSGTHAARQREMLDIQSKGKYAGYNNEGGVGLIRVVDCYNEILDAWKSIPGSLPASSDESSAQGIYDAYDKALDEYWAILRRTGEGLRLDGTQSVIGGQFQRMLEIHRDAYNAAAPKIVAETKVLGAEKHAAMQDWTDRSQTKFEDVVNAAKGK